MNMNTLSDVCKSKFEVLGKHTVLCVGLQDMLEITNYSCRTFNHSAKRKEAASDRHMTELT